MFTVRPHPPKGPLSAPFSSPGGAVVAFGGRFPALFLLLWACLCIFACLLLCTLFLGICAPGLSAVELYFFVFAWVAFSGWRLRRLILLAPSPVLFPVVSASRGSFFLRARLSSRASVPRSGFPLRSPWGFFLLLVLLRFSSLLPGAPFFLVTSFSLGTPFILVSSPVLFSASLDIFFCFGLLNFLSLYFLIFFY